MVQLEYTGTRTKPFLVKCPSEARYSVEPEISRIIEVAEADAEWILADNAAAHKRDKAPIVWQRTVAEAALPKVKDKK